MNKFLTSICIYDHKNAIDQLHTIHYLYGLIDQFFLTNRSYDIVVSIESKCMKILEKIIKQEKDRINIDNVYFKVYDEMPNTSGMVYRFKECFDNHDKYDMIYVRDSEFDGFIKFDEIYDACKDFGVNSIQCKLEWFSKTQNERQFCWRDVYLAGCATGFIFKNWKSDANRAREVIDQLLSNKNFNIYYEFDEQLLTALCFNEFLNNNVIYWDTDSSKLTYNDYITECIFVQFKKWEQYNNGNLKNSTFYNSTDNAYEIDGIKYTIKNDGIPKEYFTSQENTDQYKLRRKYYFLQVMKYMCGTINNIDIDRILIPKKT